MFFKNVFRELLKPYLLVIKKEIISEISYIQKQIDNSYVRIKINKFNHTPQFIGECWIEKNINDEQFFCISTPLGISKIKLDVNNFRNNFISEEK